MRSHARTGLVFLSAALVFAASVTSSSAQLIAYEGFSYTGGNQLNGLTADGNGGAGWAATWSATSAAIATNSGTGLSYGTLPVSGGSVVMGNPTTTTFGTTASSQRLLPNTLGTLAASGSGSVWISFLFQNWNTSMDGKIGYRETKLALFSGATGNANGTANVNGTERLDIGSPNTYAAGASDTLSLYQGSTYVSSGIATPRGANAANTVWMVMRLDVDNTVATDTAYAWFNPSLASEPAIGTAISFTANDLSAVNALRLQAGNSNTSGPNGVFNADELRVGLDWGSMVAVVPEPASGLLLALGGLAFLLRRQAKA